MYYEYYLSYQLTGTAVADKDEVTIIIIEEEQDVTHV